MIAEVVRGPVKVPERAWHPRHLVTIAPSASRVASRPLFCQRRGGAHLRAGLVPSRPARRRRLVDFGRGAARQLHGRDGARQCAAATADVSARRIRCGSSRRSRAASASSASRFRSLLPYVQRRLPGARRRMATPACSLRAAVCAVALLPPTMLMGATLPAIARWTGATRVKARRPSACSTWPTSPAAPPERARRLLPAARLRHVVATAVAVAINALAAALGAGGWRAAMPIRRAALTRSGARGSTAVRAVSRVRTRRLRRRRAVRIHRAWRRSGVDAATVAALRRQRLHVLADPRRVSLRPRPRQPASARRWRGASARRWRRSAGVSCSSFSRSPLARGRSSTCCRLAADGTFLPRALVDRRSVSRSMRCARPSPCCRPRSCGARAFRSPSRPRRRTSIPAGLSRASTRSTRSARWPARSPFTLIGRSAISAASTRSRRWSCSPR